MRSGQMREDCKNVKPVCRPFFRHYGMHYDVLIIDIDLTNGEQIGFIFFPIPCQTSTIVQYGALAK